MISHRSINGLRLSLLLCSATSKCNLFIQLHLTTKFIRQRDHMIYFRPFPKTDFLTDSVFLTHKRWRPDPGHWRIDFIYDGELVAGDLTRSRSI